VVHALEALTEKVCVPMESPERVTGVLKPESMAFGPRAAMSGLAPGWSIEWRLGSVDIEFRVPGWLSLASTPTIDLGGIPFMKK